MSTRVLIARTVSIEEISGVAAACRAKWPDARLCVLTSPNRHAELTDLGCIDEVIDYLPASFYIRWTDGRQYAAVVVPVRNGSGWGYGNVWHATSRVLASAYFIAQWGSTLRRVSVRRMMFNASFEDAVQRLCAWPARGLAGLFLAHAGETARVRLEPDPTGIKPEATGITL